jgi:hypothetical protein
MMDMEIGKNQLVEIVFDDPAEFDTNYGIEMDPIECRAVGWLLEKNDSFVRIMWLKEEDDLPYVGLAIPMGCVKQIHSLETNILQFMENLK